MPYCPVRSSGTQYFSHRMLPEREERKEGSLARLRKGCTWGGDALLAYGNGAQSLTVTVAKSDRQPRKCHRPPSDQIQTPLHSLQRLSATTSVLKGMAVICPCGGTNERLGLSSGKLVDSCSRNQETESQSGREDCSCLLSQHTSSLQRQPSSLLVQGK